MRRDNRHRRHLRRFRSVNEYSLHRNRIYLLNATRAAQKNRAVRKELLDWFRRYEEELESMDAFLMQEHTRMREHNKTTKGQPKDPEQKAAETRFINAAVKTLDEKTQKTPPPSPIRIANSLVIQRFSLTPMAGSLLELACCYSYISNSIAQRLWDQLQDAVIGHIETTAILLDCSRDEVEDALRELAEVGIADLEALNGAHTEPSDYINNYFGRIWSPPVRDMDELMARLIGHQCEATLDLSDFTHLNNGDGYFTQTGVRPPEQIRRRKRAEYRIGLCRGTPDPIISRIRRSRFTPHGPAIRPTIMGSEPGQRIAQPDGTASPPVCLHHKSVGHHRPGSRTPLRISRRVLLHGSTAHQPRLRVVLQQQSTILCTRAEKTHPRRLCQRARPCRGTGLPKRPNTHRPRPRRRMPHKTRQRLPRLLRVG